MGFWSGFEGLTGHQPGAFKGFSLKDILDKDMWERRERLNQGRRLEETGVPDTIVASIGPAGENLVRFAAIMNDRHRAAGRNGVGAVMGSKNLKAIAVRGTGSVKVASPGTLMRSTWEAKKKLKASPVTGEGLAVYGTPILVNTINEHGGFPTNNHQKAQFDKAEEISGEKIPYSDFDTIKGFNIEG